MAIIQKRYAHLNQADSGSLHRKLDATSAYITGSVEAASTLTVRGQAQFDDVAKFGDTAAAEAVITGMGGLPNLDLVVSGTIAIGDQLLVFGDITGGKQLDLTGRALVGGKLEVQGEITGSAPALLQSTLKVDGQADMVDVLPQVDLTYDLGSAAKRWAELHAGTAAFTNLEADYLDVAITASVAQLTGSAGAVFTAGNLKVEAGEVSASSDLKAGGALVVAGNADLNGALDVALGSDLHGAVIAYSTLNVQGAADLDSTLNVDGAAEFQSTISASGAAQLGATLTVAGDADLNGQLDVAGNFSVAANMFSVIAASGDTSIAGDLVVSGDLTVMGDRIEAQVTQLRIEDGLITLMSGSPSRAVSDGAGIEVDVGAVENGAKPTLAFDHTEDAWTSNLDFNPTADLTYDLGISTKRWRELHLSGDANVGGAVDAGSLAVSGEATFGASIAVTGSGSFSGALEANTVSASAGVSGGSFSTNGSLTVQGAADLNGGLDVIGAVSASGGVTAASFTADGLGDFGSLDVSGNTTLADLSVSGLSDLSELQVAGAATFAQSIAVTGSGSFTGDISAASASFSGDLDVYGTATFHGVFAVPGAGDFGSLTVGGINMSPISSSNPVSTVNASSATMLTQQLVSGDMAKYEIEVIARGASNAAAWKISVAAMHDGTEIQAAATELSKEFFGALGANLDVDIDVAGGNINVKAKGADSAGTVYWDCQIVKKMVLDSANGARKY